MAFVISSAGTWSRLAVAFALSASSLQQGAPPDYAAHVARYRDAKNLKDLPADDSALPLALDRGYAALDVGAFDVRYPWSLVSDAKRVTELKQIALALVDLQAHWLQWLDLHAPAPKNAAPPADLAAVRQWVNGWKEKDLAKAAPNAKDHKLTSLAGADDAVNAAIKSFADSMRSGSAADLKLDGAATQLVLAPTRPEFNGFIAFVGSLNDEFKKLLWTPSMALRNEFHHNDLICVALENPPADGGDAGTSMNDREKTGELEHVTQYAADRLVRHYGGATFDPGFTIGIAVDLVIDVLGENNSRVAGSGEGHSTPARYKFVRGGQSQGGKLAKMNADSRWRISLGKDYFIDALSKGQKEGAKVAIKNGSSKLGPTAYFTLDCFKEPGEHELVSAPFLGGNNAASKDVPEDFFPDYQEFLRAYRAAFVHWLETEAKAPNGDANVRPCATLLRAAGTDATTFEQRAAATFGVPYTAADGATNALEWQFLSWLTKQK